MRRLLYCIAPLVAALALGCSKETRISEVEPNQGTFNGGEEIEIKGNGFPRSGVTVRFGTHEATQIVIVSDNVIKVSSPAGDKGTVTDINVIFDDGRAFQLKNGFRYVDSTQQRNTMDKFFNKQNEGAK